MAYDPPMPTPDGNTISTMTDWEAYWVGGFGGAAGVLSGNGGELSPSINSGARTVSTATGAALVRGFYIANPSATYTASVPAQSAGDRVDRLVLRLDRTATTAANWLKPLIVQGTSGSSTPPALQTNTTGSWDLPICRWTTKADGTLTGLVDERYLTGAPFVKFKSVSRPATAPARIGLETDTSRLLYSDGSTWKAVIDDTGWVSVATDTSYWTAGSFDLQIRRIGSVVHFRGSVTRHINKLSVSDTGSHVLTIPSGYRPAASHLYVAWVSGNILAQVRVFPTGDLQLTGHVIDGISVGHSVYLDTTYMIG